MVIIVIDYKFKTFADANLWIDSLYVKYDIPFGYRSFFKHLASKSAAEIENSKVSLVEKILKREGFTFDIYILKEVVK